MRLRGKTLLYTGIVLFLLSLSLVTIFSSTILGGFTTLENNQIETDMIRIVNTLNEEISQLGSTAVDWGQWTDTYEFVIDLNDDYIESNLAPEYIINLDADFMIFADVSGSVVHYIAVDFVEEDYGESPNALIDFINSSPLLTGHPNEQSAIDGFIILDGEIYMIASRPILKDDSSGPVRGTLVVGQKLDTRRMGLFEELLNTTIVVFDYNQNNLPSDAAQAKEQIDDNNPVWINAIDGAVIEGFAAIDGIDGSKAVLINTINSREIYQQGQLNFRYFLISLITVSAVFIILITLVIDRVILKRVSIIADGLQNIRRNDDLDIKIKVSGDDELTAMASEINYLTETLGHSRLALISERDSLDRRVKDRTQELRTLNIDLNQEIAQRKAVQTQMIEARDHAVESLKFKEQILANVSHDTRTPINIIKLRAEMLLAQNFGALNQKQAAEVNSVLENTNELLYFMDNLLEEASSQSRGLDSLTLEAFDIREFSQKTIMELKPLANKRGLTFDFFLDNSIPNRITSDRNKIKQLVYNLVDNAIKYTNQGGINVRIFSTDANYWMIEVKDTGIGISDADIQTIYQPFWQKDGSVTRSVNRGVGLGLSIVKRITTQLGAKVSVAKNPTGEGTMFTIRLPFDSSNIDQEPQDSFANNVAKENQIKKENITGLIIEDDVELGTILNDIFLNDGFSMQLANDGKQAYDKLMTTTPDFILLDLHLPSLSGVDIYNYLSSEPRFEKTLITIISADADLAKDFEGRADVVFIKPVGMAQINELIDLIISKRPKQGLII